jgi:hypothetical protein
MQEISAKAENLNRNGIDVGHCRIHVVITDA